MSKSNFRLLRDLLLVLPINAKVDTDSGIIVTAVDKTAPQEGVVIDVGQGKLDENGILIEMQYKRGDRIVYARNGVRDLKYKDDTLHVVPSNEVLCKLIA